MNKVWIVGGAVVVSLGLGALIGGEHTTLKPDAQTTREVAASGLPWLIEVLPGGGSQVMGLTLADAPRGSTLADAQQRWGQDMQIAIIAAPGEDGTLEAFVDNAQAGFINGKIVLTAHLPSSDVKAMRARAIKSDFMESTTRKYTLAAADLPLVLKARITAMSFIPQANLDATTITARFGEPAQRVRINEHLEHFLYPDKGLDIALNTEGKELLQYVAPSQFERLRAPLKSVQP
ncbi:MAG: hypothetical protein Q7U28_17030 [Aquabacterium sp.]|nr:hypothetical protein [Aquabacterium sp.]